MKKSIVLTLICLSACLAEVSAQLSFPDEAGAEPPFHFEAYNYRLFSAARPAVFASRRPAGGETFDDFETWFNQTPIFAQ